VFLGGIGLCLMHRRLSSKLIWVAAGFVGLFGATGLSQLAMHLKMVGGWYMVSMMIAEAIYFPSYLLIVFGLGSALIQIRRKVAISLEPTHDRS
jgi:hypothetical protein